MQPVSETDRHNSAPQCSTCAAQQPQPDGSSQDQPSFEQRFGAAYGDLLALAIRRNPQHFAYTEAKVPQVVAKIIATIKEGGKSDWLKHNETMREAAKQCGIRTSKEFRRALGVEE